MRPLVALIILILCPNCAFADFSGKVIKVYDADTITVLIETDGEFEKKKIRLNGIDAPEKAQAYGKKAKQFASDLVHGEVVTIVEHGEDRYKRIIGDVLLEDGTSLNQEIVKAGYAWWYFKYSDDRELGQLELDAKLAHVGLWKAKNPVPPWVFRKVKDLLN